MSSENTSNKEIALKAGRRLARCKPGEEVVISGIAGVFPDSADVRHLGENLLNKVDLISDDDRRWKLEHPEIPQRTGKLLVVNKFDAAFFGVHYKQAQTMDPMSRILLEKSYEAIVDAGYNPKHLRGTKTGVFIGACFSESEKTWFYEKIQINGFGITGCSRAMLANRISYWLGINGPSYTIDSACSSSLYALEHAYRSIRDGFCDQALVGGCNLCLHPYVSLQFARLGVLSPDGRCKCFDDAANGYCRSETVCVAFLQKSKDARRIYARVVHGKTNCDGYKEQGITYPSGLMQRKLLTDFYEECEIHPSTLDYVEAHGTGTRVGDPEEVKALEAVFCPGRKDPLKIGSVKSNIGHSEPASGLCSISKVIVAMETGLIPPNINLNTLRKDVEAFQEGRITVVTEPTPWNGGLVGINSFGFGGANCHVLLSSHKKEKINKGLPADDIPRLVCVSGRTEEAVDVMIKELETNPIDVEYIRLFHEVYSDEISGHVYRGYTLLKKDDSKPIRSTEYYPGFRRPIWFVFAGMGSQWPSMGKSLMNIPLFAKSINKSHQLLKPKGLDLIKIITTSDPNIFDNILHSFVGIAAIQIGLVDVLNELEIVPDGIVGHSVGELGCSYADGCFTAEQTLLAAYYRGLASVETEFIHGSMASIGLGYNAVKDEVPADIDIACRNGPDSCTLSGPTESITKYVELLQSRGIFARRVNVSNIAYHSRYIAHAAPKLLKYLTEIIPKPNERSSKWISSSVLEENWNTEKAKYSSAEYHTNNLLSSVYFEEASKKIPPKAVVIEIAPHGLLQAILKRSLPKDVVNVPLTLRSADNTEFLLTALGKAYLAGVNCKLHKIYPTVEFPVSRGTPMIAPLVRWEHGEDWHVTSYKMQEKIKSGERTVVVSLKDDEMEYLAGHVVDGRNLYPATGYLLLAWETVAMMRGELYSEVPIVFENVRFNRATNIPKEGEVEFTIMVQKGSGNFEVIEGGAPVVSGRLYVPQDVNKEMVNMPDLEELLHDEPDTLPLANKDIYKELRLRGYNYKGLFKGLTGANNNGSVGYVLWLNNFVAFMDNMLQMQILNEDTRSLFVPTSITKLVINTKKHFSLLQSLSPEKPELPVYVFKDIDLIRSGGIECRGLKASPIARKKPLGDPVLDKYVFVPQVSIKGLSFEEIFRVFINIALENIPSTKVKTIEYVDSSVKPDGTLASPVILRALGDLPLIQADVVILGSVEHPLLTEIGNDITIDDKKLPADQSALIVSATQLLGRKELLTTALSSIKDGGFIVTRESTEEKLQPELHDLIVCADYALENERLLLLRKQPKESTINPIVIKIEGDKYSWVPDVQKAIHSLLKPKNQKLILYSEKEPLNGILGFYNALKKEPYTEDIRCVIIVDEKAPAFNIEHPLYRTQLAKDLNVNVFKNGTWGSYRHLPLNIQSTIKSYHSYANTLLRGDLSTLKWVEGPIDPYNCETNDSEELIHVYYAPLNFRDIMLATGKLSAEVITRNRLEMDCLQGFEYAGKTPSGKRYMGMVIAKTMSSVIINDVHFAWEVPDQWTLEEASTIPCVYGTVVYALITTGRIRRGESVLIHAGSGGVGQAAINICLYYECEIFTTVGTPEKREFIRKTFPQIPESHIGNSRDTSFEQMVMKETNGKGVDIVLNSLAEEKLQASVRCLGFGGRFLEIGKFDLAKNNTIGMQFFLKETSFHGVMLDQFFKSDRGVKRQLVDEVTRVIKCGAVKPLVRTVFNYDEIEGAFRYMAAGKHIGKVILKLRDEEEDKYTPPQVLKFDAVPRYLCHNKKSFIVCGGLGGFGLELADWLVLRGARYLVLTSRSGVRTGYQSMRIRIWRSYGVKVMISLDDITKKEGIKNLLETANSLGPVAGIFNLAVVLQDATFENQTEESFAASAGPKAIATSYLDELSRVMCPQLEQFVVFSSVSCGHGNAGQTNYAMSNSVMERICEARKADGLPATAIEWGAVGEVGLVAEMAEDNVDIVIGGTLQQRIASCLEVMDYLLKQPNAIVGSMVVAEKRSASSGGGTIVDTVVNILGLRDLKTVSLHSTLAELGMDSMMAVEIKQSLEREFEVFLTPQDIRSLTFAKLYEIAATVENESKDPSKEKVIGNTIPEVGAHYFLRSVGEEAVTGIPIVRVPSKLDNGSTIEVPINSAPTVFVIPSIEGNASIVEPLASNLEMQVLCVQYSYEDPKETIEEMAQAILPHILSRLRPQEPFHLIGYSYGGVVGLEVARLLEKAGYKGEICLIDSSPEFVREISKLTFYDENQSEDELQVRLLLHYISLIWPRVSGELKDDLHKVKNWNDRLDLLMSIAPEDGVRHSKRYQRLLMHAGLLRVKALFAKSESKPNLIASSAALIRPTEISIKTSDDYELSQYFKSRVLTYFVEGNHFTILENKKTAEIITSTFKVETRAKFEKYIASNDK